MSRAMTKEPTHFSKLAEELIGQLRGVPFKDPPRQVKRPAQDLGTVVEQLMVKHQIGRSSPEQTIRDGWAEVVGPANAAYSHAVRIDNGRRLIVQVTHAVIRNELFLHRAEIVARLQKLPGCGSVTELHIRAG